MRKTTKTSNKVKELLYNNFKGNVATQYGQEMEETTRLTYLDHLKQSGSVESTVTTCGLFISKYDSWLAASPDGLVSI